MNAPALPIIAGMLGMIGSASWVLADTTDVASPNPSQRPAINFFRWQEDWSALADPRLRDTLADDLKYIPLSSEDPGRYVSLGVTVRERFELNDTALFGTGQRRSDSYLLSRLELHADVHLTEATRVFVQLLNASAGGREQPRPTDVDEADLRLAFIDTSGPLWNGLYRLRVGRQEVAFDLQRFASVRDGANVRQAFDALWAEYRRDNWLVSVFASRPVQYFNDSAFDDRSSSDFTFGGIRALRRLGNIGQVTATVSQYRRDDIRLLAGAGDETRHNFDMRFGGAVAGFDWDIEGMAQRGSIGGKSIRAWGAGSIGGYTFDTAMRPRLGVQFDAASGDRNLANQRVGTFNPLFPNGYYVTQSGYTGYSNFIHLKASLTLTPVGPVKVLAAIGELWRQTTGDAIYMTPIIPIGDTAGRPGKHTSTYYQLRADWQLTRSFAVAAEINRYVVGEAVRNAGGDDATYIMVEARWGW